ncbi:carbonic anhydrase 7 isoform X2 [Phlebotomus argentipes]|uniref:carbonic anhydrase 7 isoform X2 n=1 Tax=Phlebotomus argentipes TaxID=94469 RepID=UPI0028934746|nr:carbonic anhydrase 7 isoform X2 [Phlebotomus argentipes]
MKGFSDNDWSCGLFIRCLIIVLVAEKLHCQDFGYDGEIGPSHWGEQYNTCFGKHQSPINIDSLDVLPVNLPPLEFIGFDQQPARTNLTNNGHTVMLEVDTDPQIAISGGPLSGDYVFSQLHFHWGDNDTMGSEDMIDSHSFAMELHLVFYKLTYRNSRAALEHEDGLAVLAFFFEVTADDNPAYDDFTKLLDLIQKPQTGVPFDTLTNVRQLIGHDVTNYFTYNGSLTTPPCSEVVVWIDFKEPITLSHNQIEKFRALEDAHGHKMTHNFRPTQPLGDRVVLFNTEEVIENNLNRKWPPYDVIDEEEHIAKPTEYEPEQDIPDEEFTEPSNTLVEHVESPHEKKKGFKRIFKKSAAWKQYNSNSCLAIAIFLLHLVVSSSARV